VSRPRGLDNRHRRSIRLDGYDYASFGAYFVTLCTQGRLPLFGDVVSGEIRLNGAGVMVTEIWENVTHMYPGVDGDAVVVMPNHIHAIVLLAGAGDGGVPGQGWNPAATEKDGVGATLRRRPIWRDDDGGVLGQGWNPAPTGGDGLGATLSAPCAGCPIRRDDGADPGQGRSLAPTGGDDSGRDSIPGPTGGARVTTLGDVVARFKTYTTRLYGAGAREQGWPPFEGRLWQRNYYEHIIRNERELVAIRAYIHDNPMQWAVDTENPDRL